MAVEVLAPVVDAIVGFIAWIAHMLWELLRSCARSLRYAFSPSFRASEKKRLEHRGQLYRAAYAAWGVVAVVGSIVVVGALIYWVSVPEPTPSEACARIELKQLARCVQAIREAVPK